MRHLLIALLAATTLAHPAGAAEMTTGEVRKVDKDSQKITIKHDAIKDLDMPAMTMVFRVKDTSWLDRFKAGDAIRFSLEKTPAGIYLVTDIQPGN